MQSDLPLLLKITWLTLVEPRLLSTENFSLVFSLVRHVVINASFFVCLVCICFSVCLSYLCVPNSNAVITKYRNIANGIYYYESLIHWCIDKEKGTEDGFFLPWHRANENVFVLKLLLQRWSKEK